MHPDDDDFDPDEDWPEDSDEHGTVECPECGAEIYEDSPQCPVCGEYITRGSRTALSGRPWWYILLGLIGVVATIAALLAI